MGAHQYYKVEGDKLVRLRRVCPKCDDGAAFMAEHEDRLACGRCGHTEARGGKGGEAAPEGEAPAASDAGAKAE